MIRFGKEYANKDAKIYAGDSLIFKGSIGQNGEIKIKKDTQIGEQINNVRKHEIPIKAEIV